MQADSLCAYSMDGHAQLVLPLLAAAQNREDVRLFPGLVDKVKLLSDALEANGGPPPPLLPVLLSPLPSPLPDLLLPLPV